MTEILKDLMALGFTPLNALLILAGWGLVAYLKNQLATQNTLRESWHADTRKQVENMEEKMGSLESARESDRKRIDDCEDDRKGLNERVKALTDEVATFRDCDMPDCPFRKRRKNRL